MTPDKRDANNMSPNPAHVTHIIRTSKKRFASMIIAKVVCRSAGRCSAPRRIAPNKMVSASTRKSRAPGFLNPSGPNNRAFAQWCIRKVPRMRMSRIQPAKIRKHLPRSQCQNSTAATSSSAPGLFQLEGRLTIAIELEKRCWPARGRTDRQLPQTSSRYSER